MPDENNDALSRITDPKILNVCATAVEEVLAEHGIDVGGHVADSVAARCFVQGLYALLPEPTEERDDVPVWRAADTEIVPAGYEGRLLVTDPEDEFEIDNGSLSDLALVQLAAGLWTANHPERS